VANDLSARAAVLRALHVPGTPLVLPNVWDVTSAQAVAEAGYPALATSSAAVAGSLGYADGQQAPPGEMFGAAARIARSVAAIPVTVDAEGGYGLTPDQFVDALLEAGAVGCNVEYTDRHNGGLVDQDRQADYLAGVRTAATASRVEIVINARIDVFIQAAPTTSPESLLSVALNRANAYFAAGANCVYPILLHDPALAGSFCASVPGPVNLLGSYAPAPGRIGLASAAEAGAARVSFGPDLWRAATRALEMLIPPIA
jgi:2-methylisocitrate lyase-like PEP mutase family enzyme